VANRSARQADLERDTLSELASTIFADGSAMSYSDLKSTVKTRLTVSDRTAERKVKRVCDLGIVKKTSAGLYKLGI
jgi:hypothetical protein